MLIPAIILVWVVALAFLAAGRHRMRLELRAELLDLIAGACRRGLTLPPLLASFATEIRGKRARSVAGLGALLDEGAPLSGALRALPRHLVPAHVVAAIEAAEGTPRLPAVLEAVAADAGESLALRHRFVVAALYPLLLAFLVVGLHTGFIAMFERSNSWNYRGPELSSIFVSAGIGLLIAAAAMFLFRPVLQRMGWLPGARRLGTARVLATSALLVEAGLPLDAALRRAAPAGGHARLARDVMRATDALGRGESIAPVWSALQLPAVARLRLEAAPPSKLGGVMGSVAERTFETWRVHSERLLRWMTPVAVLLIGALVLADFQLVMDFISDSRDRVNGGLW